MIDWQINNTIVISPSNFNPSEYEIVTIKNINGNKI